MRACSGISIVRWALIVFIAVGAAASLLAVLTLAIAVSRVPDKSPPSPGNIVLAVVPPGSGVADAFDQVPIPPAGIEMALERIYRIAGLLVAIAATLLGFGLLIWFMRPTWAGRVGGS